MRFFVVCTSKVDGTAYVLSEVSELAGPGRDARISGRIAGSGAVVMTRTEMDAEARTRTALHAWDVGDETSFDGETVTFGRRTTLVEDGEAATPPGRELERRRDLDGRVTHARLARLRAIETRARCDEMREATLKQRQETIALRDLVRSRGVGRRP